MKLQGKVAIITGGASGFGEATARLFARHGTLAIVIADIQDEKGQSVAASIGSNQCSYVHCDVTDEQQVKNLIDTTVNIHGKLDIMFSNAGMASIGEQTILDYNVSDAEKLFALNVRGMALCVKHAARAMTEGGVRGSIICTSSLLGTVGHDSYTDYVMSKHAVVGLMRAASVQLGKYGIRVNCVCPGAAATAMTCKMYGKDEDEIEKMFEQSSRLEGVLKAKHVADAVAFLASDEGG